MPEKLIVKGFDVGTSKDGTVILCFQSWRPGRIGEGPEIRSPVFLLVPEVARELATQLNELAARLESGTKPSGPNPH